MEYCCSVNGYLKDFENVSYKFEEKDDFSFVNDNFIKVLNFNIKDKTGKYIFLATQYFDNGIPDGDVQLSVIGPKLAQSEGYMNEFSVWLNLDRNNRTLKIQELEKIIE